MKKMKYAIAAVLLMLGFIFTSEMFMNYLDNFEETYYGVAFSFETTSKEKDEIIQDFLDASVKNQIDFFTVDDKINSDYQKTIKIYGTEGALDALSDHEIREKRYKSLFSGYMDVVFEDISKCKIIKRQEFFYFTGDNVDAMSGFRDDLAGEYGGEDPILYDSIKSTIHRIGTIWGIIYLIIILLTVYDITLQRKEYTLQVILGYDLRTVFMKNIFQDVIIFSGMYFLIPCLLNKWMNVYFLFHIFVMIFILFLLLNICANILIFKVNVQKNFSNADENQGILKINYVIKAVTLLLVSFALSVNVGLITEGIDYYRQLDFFKKHSEYEYYQLNYKANSQLSEMDGIVAQEFYKTFFKNSLIYADFSEMLSINYPTVLLNHNAQKELIEQNEEWREILNECREEKVYIAIPEQLREKDEKVSASGEICEAVLGYEGEKEIVFYDKRTQLISFNSSLHPFKSKGLKKPIVIFDNTEPVINEEMADRQLYYAYDILYDIPDKEVEDFIKTHQLGSEIVIKTNAWEAYEYNWKVVKRFTRISLVLSVILFLIEFIMVFTIVKMEYMYHAFQITLMKIFGYSQIKRILNPVFITILCGAINIVLLLLYSYKTSKEVVNMIACIVIFTVFELLIILRQAKKLERSRTALILKGERV